MRKVENTIGDIGKEEACSTTAPANHTELGAESFIFPFFCEVESERVGLVQVISPILSCSDDGILLYL